MADAKHLCTVSMLPTAATAPVINPKRKGAWPRNVVPLWKIRNMRLLREYQAAREHAARLHPGLIVKICYRKSVNFGRLCRIVRPDTAEDGWWFVEPLAGQLLLADGSCANISTIHSLWIEPHGAPSARAR